MGRDQRPTKDREAERQVRLAKALRDNLSRRKSQARGRAALEPEGRHEVGQEGAQGSGPDAASGTDEDANQGLSPAGRLK